MHVCILFLPLHRVSSSEKVDKYGRYVDFNIASIPYPGTIHVWCIFTAICIACNRIESNR